LNIPRKRFAFDDSKISGRKGSFTHPGNSDYFPTVRENAAMVKKDSENWPLKPVFGSKIFSIDFSQRQFSNWQDRAFYSEPK